ncbi:MAG: ABC transporter ATP-binding protein [Bacteroidales bacterium]|nr:ABC transporter ATP-binding protein [Bacteroidales bacterium]
MIHVKEISKVFRTDEVETTALDKISLEIKEGEFIAVMGPSGCGKSTLLNILGLLDNPSGGELHFVDKEVSRYSERQRAGLRKHNIGFIFQNFNLIDELTVFDNVALPLVYQGIGKAKRKKMVDEALRRVNMQHRSKHYPLQLSGGQQQRVAVARAVVSNPKLILADEPTGNLDSQHGEDVMNLLTELNQQGTTLVMVTHSESDASYAQRIVKLFDGAVVGENINQPKVA